jgi:tRNA-dihydrouridine synthase
LEITDEERPVGIQIYGGNLEPMIQAAKIAEEKNPELIDINAGCWVKKIAGRGAGAGLIKDPEYMQKMVKEIVNVVKLPVTVKTRIGWDSDSINILEIAKELKMPELLL